jgi:arylsulfatase A-like enzyme
MSLEHFSRSGSAHRVTALAAVICCLAAGWLPLACGSSAESHPNVLLITIDTLRADHLGTYGFGFDVSPQIDALADESVVFERAIAASGKTAPSHAAIMTSGYTREHSIGHGNGTSTLSDRITLAEAFHEAGYSTAAFVSNILLTRRIGFDRGFEVFDDELESPELNRPDVVERLAPDTTARAIAWLEAQDERPFFLWVHYQDPHGPYTPPAEAAARFDIPGAPDEAELPIRAGNSERGGIPPYQAIPGLRRVSEYRGRYAGEIFFADEWIGKLLARAGGGDTRETVVLLTADHGESFGEFGHYFKHTHTTTPDVAHVPLILRAPGLTPERRDDLVSHVDIAPTLLALAGLPAAPDASGVALVNRSGAALPAPERFVYCDNGGQLSAYGGDGFHWVSGVGSAWRKHDARPPLPFAPSSAFFRWRPATRWLRVKAPVALPAEVGRYAEHTTAMTALAPPSEADIEKLRALGYVD